MTEKDHNNPEKKPHKSPATGGKRFFKLAGMTASVGARVAKHQIKKAVTGKRDRDDEAEMQRVVGLRIAETLGELKGAAMKVGQMASQVADAVSPELADALKKLQRDAEPMPFSVIQKQLNAELSAEVLALIDEIDETPFASASIGQVHRARLTDGREVVIKVQYPGVDESCDSDLAQLRVALRMGQMMKVPKERLDEVFEELRARLHEELDYRIEASRLAEFRELHAADPGIVIPEPIEALSGQRVLTMIYEPADALDHFTENDYPPDIVNQIGHRLFSLINDQIFKHQALHSDPHPGNFGIRADGSLVVYDFGCVKRISDETVTAYADVVAAGLDGRFRDVDEALIELGIRRADGPPLDDEFYSLWRSIVLKPFLSEEPYDFGQANLHARAMKHFPDAMKHMNSVQPAAQNLMIDRVVAGHYWNLRRLGVVAAFRPELDRYISSQ